MLTFNPGDVRLGDLERIWREGLPARLDSSARAAVEASAGQIAKAAAGNAAVYGVNTGFGKLAHVKIAASDTRTLQRNLVLSHCCGVGDETDPASVRLMMALKLLSLGRGASGVRWELITLLEDMLEQGVTPVIPLQGSVGASGDLAPLAHMAAVMIGEGEAFYDGKRLPGAQALVAAGLKPVLLEAKEGLALINGTQFSTAMALAALFRCGAPDRQCGADILPVHRCRDGIDCATAPANSQASGPSRADRSGRPYARPDGRFADTRQPPR